MNRGEQNTPCKQCWRVSHSENNFIFVCAWQNCKGKGHVAKFCRGQGGTETDMNDVNGITNKPFYRTIFKIAVGGHENIRKSFHDSLCACYKTT